MAIPPELEASILRYHHVEKWRVGTIARQLGVHPDTVGLGDAEGFGLGAAGVRLAEEPSMFARGLQALVAEHAGAVRIGEGHDD
jgi:hypothetical protein